MTDSKTMQFFSLLEDRTAHGWIDWSQTEKSGVFEAIFPNYSVRIFERPNPHNAEIDYVLRIINSDGSVVEEITDVTMRDSLDRAYERFAGLYGAARRRALGVEAALNDLIKELKELPSF